MNRFYVIGTDTGIGKTVFSTILMHYFYKKGLQPFYFKPIQTGVPYPAHPESDASFVYKNVPQLKGKAPDISTGYCFSAPKAPYFAAKKEKKEINLDWIKKILEERSRGYDPIIIEGCGGIFVPVTADILIIDTIKIFNAYPILVAKAGLGTINHTLLSIEALKKRGIIPITTIFIDNENTSEDMIKENIEAIERFSDTKVGAVIKKIKDFSCIEKRIFTLLETIF